MATASDNIVTNTINWYLQNLGTMVPEEQYVARLEVCADCPALGLVSIAGVEMAGCTECGCPSETKPRVKEYFNPAKLKKIKVECPLGKWAGVDRLFNQ